MQKTTVAIIAAASLALGAGGTVALTGGAIAPTVASAVATTTPNTEAIQHEVAVDNIATSTRVAVIKDGVVVNTVLVGSDWTGKSGEWQPPAGVTAMRSENASVGDTIRGGKIIKLETVKQPEPVLTVEQLKAKDNLTPDEQTQLLKYLVQKEGI